MWSISSKEEAFYFISFQNYGYSKALFMRERVVSNQIPSIDPLRRS